MIFVFYVSMLTVFKPFMFGCFKDFMWRTCRVRAMQIQLPCLLFHSLWMLYCSVFVSIPNKKKKLINHYCAALICHLFSFFALPSFLHLSPLYLCPPHSVNWVRVGTSEESTMQPAAAVLWGNEDGVSVDIGRQSNEATHTHSPQDRERDVLTR